MHHLFTLQEVLTLIAAQDTQINLMLELKSVGLAQNTPLCAQGADHHSR